MIPQYPQQTITRPFADNGNTRVIPDQKQVQGQASYAEGFPVETQLPLSNGGIAPSRLDFNGILNVLSSFAFWQQSGGQMIYKTTLNYTQPALVYSNGKMWWCVADNGPDALNGVVTPGTNANVWVNFLDFLGAATPHIPVVSGGSGITVTPNGGDYNVAINPSAMCSLIASTCPPPEDGAPVVSHDVGNAITAGSDGGAFFSGGSSGMLGGGMISGILNVNAQGVGLPYQFTSPGGNIRIRAYAPAQDPATGLVYPLIITLLSGSHTSTSTVNQVGIDAHLIGVSGSPSGNGGQTQIIEQLYGFDNAIDVLPSGIYTLEVMNAIGSGIPSAFQLFVDIMFVGPVLNPNPSI